MDATTTKFYLSGPMSGYENFNRSTFRACRVLLAAVGVPMEHILSPGDIRLPDEDEAQWSDYMRKAIPLMLRADALLLLPGWKESQGVALELVIALTLGMDVYLYEEFFAICGIHLVADRGLKSVSLEQVRVRVGTLLEVGTDKHDHEED